MTAQTFHLAHLNIARIKAPVEDPIMAGFIESLAALNTTAEQSPGFVWRLQDAHRDVGTIRPFGDNRVIINFSLWEDLASLYDFTYRSARVGVLTGRRQLFLRLSDMSITLWWVLAGYRPLIEEALARREYLKRHGPSPAAFTFAKTYAPIDPTTDFTEDVAI
jgi:Domain of unknown function (DUF3291)